MSAFFSVKAIRLRLSLCLFGLFISTALCAEPLVLMVEESIHKRYQQFLANRSPYEITEFTGPGISRGVAELILVQQALKAGGVEDSIAFSYGPNHARIVREVGKGAAVMAVNSTWLYEVADRHQQYWLTEPVIHNGEFEAGLYTLAENQSILAMNSWAEIRSLSAISNKQWQADWKTLSEMKFAELQDVAKWGTMVKMVIAGRADLLLAPFQATEDFSFTSQGHKFLPIPGIKLGLNGTRHFIVSRSHPEGERVYHALQIGIGKLQQAGTFEKAYRESGFLNTRVSEWKRLN